jgi:CIC family chloride channel protein
VVGVITTEVLRIVTQEPEISAIAIAYDLMGPPMIVGDGDDVKTALELLLVHGAREIVVVDDDGRIVGFLDEAEITQLYRNATEGSGSDGASPARR